MRYLQIAIVCLGFSVLLSFTARAQQAPAVTGTDDQATYADSVVMIRAVHQGPDYVTPWKQMPMSQGLGSAFLITGNIILTNAHNVGDYKYIELKKQNLAKRYPARVKFVGHDCDLAIIEVADSSFYDNMVPLELGGLPKANSTVRICGFPVGGNQVSITEGVVSRLEVSVYSHNQADAHLVVQTDAAINPGNSGGPVLQNGKVVGVAFQGLRNADNIGYMIPTTVIRHFIRDIEDGRYDGFGSLGISIYPGLHSKSYAEYLQVPAGKEGVVVIRTSLNSPLAGILRNGDVLTGIDDYDIDNDGMIKIHGLALNMTEALEQKQIGEKITLRFYRAGQLKTAEVEVRSDKPVLPYSRSFDQQPNYEVFAGYVFVQVGRNYLESWGGNWLGTIPFYLRYLFFDSDVLNTDRQRKEYVVLSAILPDEVSAYNEWAKSSVVDTINDIRIMSLDQLPEAIAKSRDSFCIITFMGKEQPMIIDYPKALRHDRDIRGKYQLPNKTDQENKP